MRTQPFQLIKKEIQRKISAKNILSIVLFGSAVNSPESAHDYDVLIVTKRLPLQDWVVAGEIKFNLLGRVDKPVDVIFMEEEDLAYTSPFIYEVSRKSKVLYGKNIIPGMKKSSRKVRSFAEGGVHCGWKIAE